MKKGLTDKGYHKQEGVMIQEMHAGVVWTILVAWNVSEGIRKKCEPALDIKDVYLSLLMVAGCFIRQTEHLESLVKPLSVM